jgi:hypothetical protein
MSHQGTLSEEDFKVEGHACAVAFPAIKALEDGIDFQADEAVKAYMAEHYEMVILHQQTCATRETGRLNNPIIFKLFLPRISYGIYKLITNPHHFYRIKRTYRIALGTARTIIRIMQNRTFFAPAIWPLCL